MSKITMNFSRIRKGNDMFELGLPHKGVPIDYVLIPPDGRQKYFTFLAISMGLVKSKHLCWEPVQLVRVELKSQSLMAAPL